MSWPPYLDALGSLIRAEGLKAGRNRVKFRECVENTALQIGVGLFVHLHQDGEHASQNVTQADQREQLVPLSLVVEDLSLAGAAISKSKT